jgi:hypothetical protein
MEYETWSPNSAAIENNVYNDLDSMSNYPNDFSEEYLLALFRNHLRESEVQAWLAWKRDYDAMSNPWVVLWPNTLWGWSDRRNQRESFRVFNAL